MKQSLKKLDKYKIKLDNDSTVNKNTRIYKFNTLKNDEQIIVILMALKDADCIGLYSDFEISIDDVRRIVSAFFNATDYIIMVKSFNLDEINPDFLYSVFITSPKIKVYNFLRAMNCEVCYYEI